MRLVLIAAIFGLFAHGAQLKDRCEEDKITDRPSAVERNAWALKCGYIDQSDFDFANKKGLYWTFVQGNAPRNRNMMCFPGWSLLGMCGVGCYTPEMRLLFGGDEREIVKAAYDERTETVTGLVRDAKELRFEEKTISYFLAGKTKEKIFVLETDTGRTLKVTHEHPLVDGAGNLFRADSARVGMTLLTAEGRPALITRVTTEKYEGKVWNVAPESKERGDNILVAEGFLTGSARFQNEWAHEAYRLSLRHSVDVGGL